MAPRTERRADALSKARIVDAAIELLDADGERGLTFRALAARLSTGPGALYWHVANKDELLAAATDAIVGGVLAEAVDAGTPEDAIRTVALGVFDAIDAHPWVGAQLAGTPGQSALLALFEALGSGLDALGVPDDAQFAAVSALVNYVLGVAGQNAANARRFSPGTDRDAVLAAMAARWTAHDPADFPFVHRIAAQLRDHDDREQFLAGIDLILAGIGTAR